MAHESTIVFGLIEQALRRPVDLRRAFVEKACEGDPELLAEVLGMLAVVERDVLEAATLPSPPPPPGSTAIVADESSLASSFTDFELQARQCAEPRPTSDGGGGGSGGYWIGPYKLMSLLGEGGFGAVFLAERREPVRFRVALKVIRPGKDTKQVLARFEQERQVLALMDHPGIARVIDAGATAAGRPFFAMEFVPGKPITKYCDEHRLSIPERLQVFSMVCQAVQHAHDRGVIHRDLKPGNIMVREIDGRPVVKVIDFGIAKATMHLKSAEDIYTREGVLIGTPEYMSPEQADNNALDIDTRTDVFSLGVILYELLAGTLPIASDTLREAQIYEAYRIIREVERPRASTRLSELDKLSPAEMLIARSRAKERGQDSPDAAMSEMLSAKRASAQRIATQRQIGVEDLRRRLRRELDWILQKTLELPRTRRYDSPRALAEDIGRYLRGEAIHARPASMGYTTRKFVRKHRLAVGTGGAVLAAIVIGAGVAVWKWREAVAERNATDELLAFVNTAVVGAAKADDPRGRIPISKARVDDAVKSFSSRFADRPAIRERIRDTFALAYLAAGEPARTVEMLSEGASDPTQAKVSSTNAQFMGTALFRMRRSSEAVAVLEAAVADTPIAPNAQIQEDLVQLRDALAGALKWADRFGDSRSMYQTVGALRQSAAFANDEYFMLVEYDLTLLDVREAKWLRDNKQIGADECRARLNRALTRMSDIADATRAKLGPEHDRALMSGFERASVRADLEDYDAAIADAKETLPMMEELLGPRHWWTLDARSRFGSWLLRANRPAEARPWLERAYAGYVAVLGPNAKDTITTGIWLGRALHDDGNTAAALALFRRIIESAEQSGADPLILADRIERIAARCEEYGEAAEAVTWRERAKRLKQRGAQPEPGR